MVRVTPEVSRIAVLIAGRPKAGMTSKEPSSRGPTLAGPLVGQAFWKPSQSSGLKIFTPSPPIQGTDRLRA